ncbi:hypothetical protein ABEF95_010667 [Exophiala dermatitidis]
MAVQQTGPPAAPPISIPSRSSSLGEQPRFYVPFLESAYITWPAPRSRYTPPKPVSPDDVDAGVIEPFPDFQDPSTNLIIARTVLLDNLHRQGSACDPTAPLSVPFRSLYSRITPLTGHIKVDEDLTRQRASVDHIMDVGQTLRTQRMLGNTGKPASLGGTYPVSVKDPEPKDILKYKLKKQARKGITEATKIQKALECFATDAETENNNPKHERGRSTNRKQRRALATIHTTYGPERAIQNLLMLRETYPAYFMPGTLNAALDMTKTSNPDTQESQSKALVISSKPAALPIQGLQGLGIYPAPLASHPTSDKSVSMSTIKSVKQSTTSFVRRLAVKAKSNFRNQLTASSNTSSNATVTDDYEAPAEGEDLSSAKQTVGAGEHMADFDFGSFPLKVMLKPIPAETEAEAIPTNTRTMTPSRPVAAATGNENEMASKRHGRCFYIEREPVTVLPAELEEKDESNGETETESYVNAPASPLLFPSGVATTNTTQRSRSLSDSAVITSLVSEDESSLDTEFADQYTAISRRSSFDESDPAVQVAEMVTFTKPSSPPRIITIPARSGKSRTETTSHERDNLNDWVMVNKPSKTAVQGKAEHAHHPHAFRGYMTGSGSQTRQLRRPRSMIVLPTTATSRRHMDNHHLGDAYAAAPASNNSNSDSDSDTSLSSDSDSDSAVDGPHVLSNMVSALGRELFGRQHPF